MGDRNCWRSLPIPPLKPTFYPLSLSLCQTALYLPVLEAIGSDSVLAGSIHMMQWQPFWHCCSTGHQAAQDWDVIMAYWATTIVTNTESQDLAWLGNWSGGSWHVPDIIPSLKPIISCFRAYWQRKAFFIETVDCGIEHIFTWNTKPDQELLVRLRISFYIFQKETDSFSCT